MTSGGNLLRFIYSCHIRFFRRAFISMKHPTQADVAKLAGVSRATVSYVVSGNADTPISSETRTRVLGAVAQLNYAPDARARNLRSGGSNTVGLLIPDSAQPPLLEHCARGGGYHTRTGPRFRLLTSTSLDPEREQQALQALSARRMECAGSSHSSPFWNSPKPPSPDLAASGYPVVTLGNTSFNVDAVVATYRTPPSR